MISSLEVEFRRVSPFDPGAKKGAKEIGPREFWSPLESFRSDGLCSIGFGLRGAPATSIPQPPGPSRHTSVSCVGVGQATRIGTIWSYVVGRIRSLS